MLDCSRQADPHPGIPTPSGLHQDASSFRQKQAQKAAQSLPLPLCPKGNQTCTFPAW